MIAIARNALEQGGYAVETSEDRACPIVMFEDDLILGFLLCFPNAETLLENWRESSQRILQNAQFALRRSERKAWNAYFVFLAEATADYGQSVRLGAIEEDLVGTRKIAKAGVRTANDVHAALLPLLAIQNAPRLEAVDMSAEIRMRTSELPHELVAAFLSDASETIMAQLLEILDQ